MNIGLDMMGGDFAPQEAVNGVAAFLSANTNATLWLIGDEAQLKPLLAAQGLDTHPALRIIHASQVIEMDESPTKALKEKQQSSIAIGFHLLATGKTDAFISAGNTGAMLVGALYSIKAIPGVQRPTISTIVPMENGKTGLLLDVGINADCKPEHLQQFAILGSLYARHILNIDNPRVALLNIGEEEGKGNILAKETWPLLNATPGIHFIGNVEGRDVLYDKADVMVCEGFTGNIVLKLLETLHDLAVKRNINDAYFDRFNFEQYGGVPVLGVAKPVIIGHGISKGTAFSNMLELAQKIIATDLLGKMKESFAQHA